MAHNSYARLTANGEALTGDVTVSQIGGVDVSSDHIEVMRITFGVDANRDAATAGRTGRRQYQPIRFVKRIDRTTPLLYRAVAQNQRLEGEFRLFDNDPTDGTIRQFFTIALKDAALTSIASVAPDTRDADLAAWIAYEEITLTFAQITFTDEQSSTEFEDQINQTR